MRRLNTQRGLNQLTSNGDSDTGKVCMYHIDSMEKLFKKKIVKKKKEKKGGALDRKFQSGENDNSNNGNVGQGENSGIYLSYNFRQPYSIFRCNDNEQTQNLAQTCMRLLL